MVICLERGADLHMAQLMPLPPTFSCFSKIEIRFTFLVPIHSGSPGQKAVKRVCVCVRACMRACVRVCVCVCVFVRLSVRRPVTILVLLVSYIFVCIVSVSQFLPSLSLV